MQMARVGPAVVVIDDRVYAIGGENAEGPLRSMEVWEGTAEPRNPVGQWWIGGTMTVPRVRHTATVLDDGQVLVAGGGQGHPRSRLAELWDGQQFVPAGQMRSVRSRHTATRLQDGRVLVIGGRDQRGMPIGEAEIWEPKSRTWRRAGRLHQARCCHTATLLRDGRVLVVAGLVSFACLTEDEKPPCYKSIDSVEIWDPRTGRFTAAAPLGDNNDRAAHTATLLQDGRVLIAGGAGSAPNDSDGDSNVVDLVWDPSVGAWQPIEPGAFRVYHTATLLPDGRVVAIGGTHDACGCCAVLPGSGPFMSNIKLFDPAMNRWRAVGESLVPRDRHGAAVLSDGSVLVIGGESQDYFQRGVPFGTTERWLWHD